jgi:valyl-tRNA synthetase
MQIERGREAGYVVAYVSPLATVGSSAVQEALASETPLETRWIYARLSAVCVEVERALQDYRFDEAANAVYQFFWGEFCDWYVELVKLRLDFEAPKNDITALTLHSLVSVFEAALRLLSPFMPFITEELWHALHAQLGVAVPAKSIALTRFPQKQDFVADEESAAAMSALQELIVTVRGLRKELGVPEKEAAAIQVHSSGNVAALAGANADMLAKQARVSEVQISSVALTANNARATAAFDVAVLYERQIDVPAERERLQKDIAKYDKGLQAAERQLGNEGFVAKAPAHIVEGLKKQSAETRALKEKAEAALAALPSA